MEQLWFRPLVWTDYRLAVVFTVILPIILLIWSLVQQVESIQRLLIIYWRVASLLLITVYLMIASWPIAFMTSFAARVLIPISLWFWVDLNDEIRDLPKSVLKLTFTSWRWAVTIYTLLGAIAILPFYSCAFTANIRNQPFCEVWSEAPWGYKAWMHPNLAPSVLGFFGMVGLFFYVIYLSYFLLIRLGKQGRSALEQ
jgi:Protein of unknown function (DUF3177)